MSTVPLYPLRFKPILRRLIWGGQRLGSVLHKPIGIEADYAESWELADYHDQVSVVENGSLAGATLRDLVHTRPDELLGQALGRGISFRFWSSLSTLTKTSPFRCIPTTKKAADWQTTTARPKPGSSSTASREA